ncbi:MAG: hypothetical protein LBJ69_02965 [Holosporales bacterium]|jgi:hypothetical protein|nr:hypothetical protein [Holosporales bacterium]
MKLKVIALIAVMGMSTACYLGGSDAAQGAGVLSQNEQQERLLEMMRRKLENYQREAEDVPPQNIGQLIQDMERGIDDTVGPDPTHILDQVGGRIAIGVLQQFETKTQDLREWQQQHLEGRTRMSIGRLKYILERIPEDQRDVELREQAARLRISAGMLEDAWDDAQGDIERIRVQLEEYDAGPEQSNDLDRNSYMLRVALDGVIDSIIPSEWNGRGRNPTDNEIRHATDRTLAEIGVENPTYWQYHHAIEMTREYVHQKQAGGLSEELQTLVREEKERIAREATEQHRRRVEAEERQRRQGPVRGPNRRTGRVMADRPKPPPHPITYWLEILQSYVNNS